MSESVVVVVVVVVLVLGPGVADAEASGEAEEELLDKRVSCQTSFFRRVRNILFLEVRMFLIEAHRLVERCLEKE